MANELLFTKQDKIATITLNRPEKLNTFHDGMLADWAAGACASARPMMPCMWWC